MDALALAGFGARRRETRGRPTRAARALVGSLVLGVHALALWLWPAARLTGDAHPAPPWPRVLQVSLAVVPAPDTPPEASAATPAQRRPPRRIGAAPQAAAVPLDVPTPGAEDATRPPTPDGLGTPPADASGGPQAATATEPTPGPLRLSLPRGAGAERASLTDPPGSMRRAALNDPRANVRADPTRALPDAVAASVKGDCLKGEFAGGGMGLLSLPFLAVAAVRGDCKPQR